MSDDIPAGFIFGCTLKTESECRRKKLFGLPPGRIEAVSKVAPGTPLFLYNYDLRVLYGVFEAKSHGGWAIDEDAWGGCFPAQIKVKGIGPHQKRGECLIKDDFSDAIRENFFTSSKFSYALSQRQVRRLERLFRSSGWSPSWTPGWKCERNVKSRGIQKRGQPSRAPLKARFMGRPFAKVRERRVIARACPIRFQTPPTRRFLRERSQSTRRSDVMDYEMEMASVNQKTPMATSKDEKKEKLDLTSVMNSEEIELTSESTSDEGASAGRAGDGPNDVTVKDIGEATHGMQTPMSPHVYPVLD